MDVVKTHIERIGGTVDVQSQAGQGTTVKIKIPLTLAIIPALIVRSGEDRYAIPQVSLLELVRLEPEQARTEIHKIHSAPVYRLRGSLLPLVYLARELGNPPEPNGEAADVKIVVLQADDRPFGLVVEAIHDSEEIVVKPLSMQLKGITVFAGATILGDGRVALILDVLGIAQRAGVVSEVRERALAAPAEIDRETKAAASGDLQTLLLLGLGPDNRIAIPLSQVARLEEIPATNLEWADGREVVQYRGQILPLIRLAHVFHSAEASQANRPLQVVVYTDQHRSVGLVVDHIVDIIETPLVVQRTSHRAGLLGSAIIQGRVTNVLDVHGVIESVDPDFFAETATR
jgi:two-component system chemotaxis sensor kinase CheA